MSLTPYYDKLLGTIREKDTAATSLILTDSNGVQWIVTVDTAGHLITTQVSTTAGTPIGLLLSLTHSS